MGHVICGSSYYSPYQPDLTSKGEQLWGLKYNPDEFVFRRHGRTRNHYTSAVGNA